MRLEKDFSTKQKLFDTFKKFKASSKLIPRDV